MLTAIIQEKDPRGSAIKKVFRRSPVYPGSHATWRNCLDQFPDRFVVAVKFLAQTPVIEGLQGRDPAVDHTCREILFSSKIARFASSASADSTQEAGSRLNSARRSLNSGPEDIPADVEPLSSLERTRHGDPVQRPPR